MSKNSWSKQVFKLSLLLCGVSLLVVVIEVVSYWREEKRLVEAAKINGKQEAVRASKYIENRLRQLQNTATSIAWDLTEGRLTDRQLLERAKKELEQNPDFLEVGAAYKPFAYNPNIRLYAPFYTRKTGKIQLEQIEKSYDYTKPENYWYYNTLADGSLWVEPGFDKSSGTIVADYDVAFYRIDPQTKEKTPVGIVYANYSVDTLKTLINSLELGKSGYGFLISNKGVILAHPNRDYVKNQKTVFDIAEERKSPQLRLIGEKAIKVQRAALDFVDEFTGQSSWVFIEPIPLSGWSMAVVVNKNDNSIDKQTIRLQLIRLTLEVILFLFFLSIIVFRADKGSVKSLWTVAFTFSASCLAGIGFIWYLALSDQSYKNNRNLLLSQARVNNLLNPQVRAAEKLNQKPPLYVPTGFFVQAIKFNSSTDVLVNGYIWQKYDNNFPNNLPRGFILPEGYDDIKIEEAYRYKRNNVEVIGWYFEATLRQNFDFSKYPFDLNDVWIRLWPKAFTISDIDRSIILVPDLASYETIDPISKPGLEQDFVLEGFQIEGSFFEYKFNSYNTNFGLSNTISTKQYPELYFTVILKRAFIGIFISKIIPLAVVTLLLFAILPLSSEHGIEIIGACAGFIFIVILDQISLRGLIPANGIIYFEYFYFAIYLFILLVVINALLLTYNRNIPFIQYQNNFIPKLLYWPSLLGLLLITTALIFY